MQGGEDESAVMPDLVGFEELNGEDVHEFEFSFEGSVDR